MHLRRIDIQQAIKLSKACIIENISIYMPLCNWDKR